MAEENILLSNLFYSLRPCLCFGLVIACLHVTSWNWRNVDKLGTMKTPIINPRVDKWYLPPCICRIRLISGGFNICKLEILFPYLQIFIYKFLATKFSISKFSYRAFYHLRFHFPYLSSASAVHGSKISVLLAFSIVII